MGLISLFIAYLPFIVPFIVFPIIFPRTLRQNLALGNSATYAKGAGIFKAALITLLILGVDLYVLRPFGILPDGDMLGILHAMVASIVGAIAVFALVMTVISER